MFMKKFDNQINALFSECAMPIIISYMQILNTILYTYCIYAIVVQFHEIVGFKSVITDYSWISLLSRSMRWSLPVFVADECILFNLFFLHLISFFGRSLHQSLNWIFHSFPVELTSFPTKVKDVDEDRNQAIRDLYSTLSAHPQFIPFACCILTQGFFFVQYNEIKALLVVLH